MKEMLAWEQEFVNLIEDTVEKLPRELTEEHLVHLRAYIGRELSNRAMKEKAQGEPK